MTGCNGVLYMTFGEYFNECIKENGCSINQLARLIDINRGNFYGIIGGTRKIKSEDLFKIIRFLGLSAKEEKTLLDLYFADYYGSERYEKLLFILDELNRFRVFEKPDPPTIGECTEKLALENENEVLYALDVLIQDAGTEPIITNYPYELKKVDDLFYSHVYRKTTEKLIHIVSASDMLKLVFSSLRYFYFRCFPFYTYESTASRFSVYPYYAVSSDRLVLFGEEQGILIKDAACIAAVRRKGKELLESCTQLGGVFQDIFEVKDTYSKVNDPSAMDIVTFSRYACITMYLTHEMIEAVARPELPNRQALIQMTHTHYSTIRNNINSMTNFIGLDGLDKFIETGNVSTLPKEYVTLLPKKKILEVLTAMREGIESGSIFIFDDKHFSVPWQLVFELNRKSLSLFGYYMDDPNFLDTDIYHCVIDDPRIVKLFFDFKDYLIRTQKVYEKRVALALVDNRIETFKKVVEAETD